MGLQLVLALALVVAAATSFTHVRDFLCFQKPTEADTRRYARRLTDSLYTRCKRSCSLVLVDVCMSDYFQLMSSNGKRRNPW